MLEETKVSKLVRETRQLQKLDQLQLAEKAKISDRHLARIEDGEYDGKLTKAVSSVLKALGLSVDSFLTEDALQDQAKFNRLATEVENHFFAKRMAEAKASLEQLVYLYSKQRLTDEMRQRVLLLQGTLSMNMGEGKASLKLLAEAIAISQPKLLTKSTKENVSLDLAEIQTRTFARQEYDIIKEIATGLAMAGQYADAIEIYGSILKSFESGNLDTIIVERFTPTILYNVAYTYDKMNETDQALTYIQQTIDYCEQTGNHRILAPAKDLQQKFIVLFSQK